MSARSCCGAELARSGFAVGKSYLAQPDEKGEIDEAAKKLAADPKNIDLLLALGAAQAKAWRYRDAISTYSRVFATRI